MKFIYSIFIFLLLVSCQNDVKNSLREAEVLAEDDPETALELLDSVKSTVNLSVEQLAQYYFIKWHAAFKCEGDLRNFVPSVQVPEYWQKKGDKQKAAYTYFYTGIMSAHQSSLEQAAICYNEAQKLALGLKDSVLVFYTYYFQGKLFLENHEFRNGEVAFQKALQYEQRKVSTLPFHDIIKIANCYLYTNNYERSKDYYNLVQDKIDDGADTTATAKILYLASRNIRNKEMKGHIAAYLKSGFKNDKHAQIYNKLVNAELCLRSHQLEEAYRYLSEIPGDTILKMPEIILQYYRIQGRYYFQKGDHKKAISYFRNYLHTNDSLKTNLFHVQINSVIKDYTQSKLESEISLVHAYRISLILGGIVLFLLCLLVIFVAYISKKKRNEKLMDAEMRIEMLQELCNTQRDKQDEYKKILFNKLEISHQLVNLSSQQIPKNASFLKLYNEMLGDLHPSELHWQEFYSLIDCLYDDFYTKLPVTFSELNEKEIQTVCLLCGGFKTDEIAFVLNQTTASVHKRKTIIRKKLNLGDRTDIVSLLMERMKNDA